MSPACAPWKELPVTEVAEPRTSAEFASQFPDLHGVITKVADQYHFPPTPQFLTDAQYNLAALLREIAQMFEKIFGHSGIREINSIAASNVLRGILTFIGVSSFLFLVYALFIRLIALEAQAKRAKSKFEGERLLSAYDYRNEASIRANHGDWRNACRFIYLSSLRLLDEENVLPFNSARSNYEYWYALASRPPLQRSFRGLANIFDAIWFGNFPASRENYGECLNYLVEIEQTLLSALPEKSIAGASMR